MPDVSDSWTTIRARLEELGAEPVLIGALAANIYRAEPRQTASLRGVAEAFTAAGFDVRSVSEPDGEPYLAYVRAPGLRADLILAETDYQRLAIDRARDGILTVEDVIVHKLLAWRPRDQDDIRSILATRPTLDHAYLDHWTAQWQVRARWDEARSRWGHEPPPTA